MVKLILALCLMAIAGCSTYDDAGFTAPLPTTPYGFVVQGATEAELAALRSAADDWCAATWQAKCPAMSGGDSSVEITTATLRSGTDGNSSFAPNGSTEITVHVDAKSDRSSPAWLAYLHMIVLHEIGHALGCHKHLGPGTAMSGTWAGLADEVTPDDAKCVMSAAT